ncbi:proton pump-interactor 1-like [Trifolium pratense]|uniref:proton pump-interactor 1-like n=1 Tax=Trifolium pratense TaxID=57577 RepID=UPI001E6958AE|nr:proton pump-interactor 1-like [Trifolium pratense]
MRQLSCNGGNTFFYQKHKNLEEKMRQRYHLNDRQKLVIEIEQFQNQHMERASKYDSLKKSIKDQIKLLCDEDYLGNRRKCMECGIRIRNGVKKLEAINAELNSLRAKLSENYKKKYRAYQRILNLKQLYLEETIDYYQHCSYINKVHQLAEEKDVAALGEMSISEVGKFMLEWNNNKAFREDYAKNVLQSLGRRQLSGDGRIRPDK